MKDYGRIKKNISSMIEQGAPESDIDEYLSMEGVTSQELRSNNSISLDSSMDTSRGAPATVRAVVGPSSRKPEDRLSTLKKYYPDAKPYQDDNFVFTDPKTKRPTLFNPEGFDVGDAAEYGRVGAEMLGGAGGGLLGLFASTPTGMTGAPLMVPAGVGLGAEGAGQIYDLGLEWLSGRNDTRSLGQRSADASASVMTNAVGQKIGAELPHAIKSGLGGIKNKLAGRSGPQLITDYSSAKVPIQGAASSITGSTPTQGFSNALAKLPSSANQMEVAADKTLTGITNFADNVATKYGPTLTRQGAGETILKGAKNAANRFTQRRSFLDDSVVKLVGQDTPANIAPVKVLLGKLNNQYHKNPNTSGHLKKAIAESYKIVNDAENGKLTFDALRQFRTDLGTKLEMPSTATGYVGKESQGVRQVYNAVRDSLKKTASGVSKDAEDALTLHDRYVRFNSNVNLPDLDDIVKKDAEQAFKFAMNRSKDGGVKLARLRKNFTPQEWDVVAATTIKDMGRATPGAQNAAGDQFSTSTFLTNWNKLSPEAKGTLFSGKRYRALRPELDRLVRISASAKDVNAMKNFSGTAQQHVYMQLLMGGGGTAGGYAAGGPEGAVIGAGAAFLLPHQAAKLITNPKFVKWLAQGVTVNPVNYNGLAGHLGRLAAVSKVEPEIKEEINQFINAFRTTLTPQQPSAEPTHTRPSNTEGLIPVARGI